MKPVIIVHNDQIPPRGQLEGATDVPEGRLGPFRAHPLDASIDEVFDRLIDSRRAAVVENADLSWPVRLPEY
ncbi:MAG: hypothetical protein NT137_07535 [Methanomassiliicoccales archaeon]|nr:hypothetical protein [Methanomassiliicoccales archaeon]